MFRKRKEICTRLSELIAKFKEKEALSPEKTMLRKSWVFNRDKKKRCSDI
jgi:hypothetical protein